MNPVEIIHAHLLTCMHYGHRVWCAAIRGPDREKWYQDELCNCSRRDAIAALAMLRDAANGGGKDA